MKVNCKRYRHRVFLKQLKANLIDMIWFGKHYIYCTVHAESRFTASGLYKATRDFQPTHSEREPIPKNTLNPWRNYEVEIVVKVVIFLTRKTTGNRIYSLHHRIKKGHQILQRICSGSFSFSICVYGFVGGMFLVIYLIYKEIKRDRVQSHIWLTAS
jgi:hypothetical protein